MSDYRYIAVYYMLRRIFLLLSLVAGLQATALEVSVNHSLYFLPDLVYPGKLNPYLELYWQVKPNTLQYHTNTQKQIVGRIISDLTITNDSGKIIKEDHYVFETSPRNTASEILAMNILELKRYLLLSGRVTLRLQLTDESDSTNTYRYTDSFTVPRVPANSFISDISLIDTFFQSDVRSPFRKHGWQFIPLCQPFLDDFKHSVSYFTEVYYPEKIDRSRYPLHLKASISRKEFAFEDPNFITTDTISDSLTPYIFGTFEIAPLKSGNYYLNVSVTDQRNDVVARKSIFFQRYNAHPVLPAPVVRDTTAQQATAQRDTGGVEKVTVVNLEKTFLKNYSLAQVKAILKMILPVADKDGQRAIEGFLKRPDENYMRYFIFNYFSALDKDKPERAWKEYSERVKEVNKLFNTHGKLGYETQRGFMYLRYGAPTEVITVTNDRGALPYEIWQYNALAEKSGKTTTNAFMLFYKREETDYDYVLLHTNIGGELHNPGWRSYLYLPGNDVQTADLKAEFYIGNK
ncbi:MAG: GWxTD domain-containing protein [Chitinophagia bacterium]|nr:GWxTD domain-containing protein [Chitinophagia bacterium]